MVTKEQILEALQEVIDPELGVDIVNLGLIYSVEIFKETGTVLVDMTLTTPGCPLSDSMSAAAERVLLSLEGVEKAKINIVWHPAWDASKMSTVARKKLGM